MSERTKQKMIAILKGYKVRKALKFDAEILNYIGEIRLLERELSSQSKDTQNEIKHSLSMKKHLFHHTLKQKIKLQKQSKR